MQLIENAAASPKNMGEMESADAMGTVGSTNCGDMLRLWIKFKEEKNGRRVIDRATFQSFGCQTAIAVASVATELIRGKTPEEALSQLKVAKEAWLEAAKAEGKPIPRPRYKPLIYQTSA